MDDIPILPVIYAHRLVELMQEESIDTESLLREAGINPHLLQRPDSMLSMRQAQALITRYVGLSSRTLPAIRFGQRLDLISHGLLGHVYLWRGEFRDLIEGIVAYLRVRFPLMNIELAHGKDYFGIRLSCRVPLQEMETFLLQTFLASLHTLGSAVIRNIAIHCRHDLFADVSTAQHLLKIEINNDHDSNEIRFYAAAVQLQARHTSAVSSDAATQDEGAVAMPAEAASLDPFHEHGFVVRLRGKILSQLRNESSAEEIASSMGMSVRTLRRRLSDCGMSFNNIRLDVRMQVAMRYLTTTTISIERIADFVGYSDQATFTRAFKEWKGNTPNQVRNQRMQYLRISKTNDDFENDTTGMPPLS
ncbi:MAG: helix-turn-helix domain-containing protein [Moraxellaceae bacterium]